MLSGFTSQKSIFVENFNSDGELDENEKTEKVKNYNFGNIQQNINDFTLETFEENIEEKTSKNPFSKIFNIC